MAEHVCDLAEVVATAALVGLGEEPLLQFEAVDAVGMQGETCDQLEDFGAADVRRLPVEEQVAIASERLERHDGARFRRPHSDGLGTR